MRIDIFGDITVKQLLSVPEKRAHSLSLELEERMYELLAMGDKIESKYISFGDHFLSLRGANRLHSDLDFKVWKLGAWSTTRIDAMEKMSPEQTRHWLNRLYITT